MSAATAPRIHHSARRRPRPSPSYPSPSVPYGDIAPVGAAPAIIVLGPIRCVPGAYISVACGGAATGTPDSARWMSGRISPADWEGAVGRVLGHCLQHDRVGPGRDLRIDPRRRYGVLPDVLVGDGDRGVAGERRAPGEQFVQQAAGGVQVAARVYPLTAGLLRIG